MMKLRYLFNNPALAQMLLENWAYDPSSLELFQHFRISANAIYPLRRSGEVCFLRFCPVSEKPPESIPAELEFIDYLHSRGYPALEALPAKNGATMVQKTTLWGEYFASLFRRVKGTRLCETELTRQVVSSYGAALGELHNLASQYTPRQATRWTHTQVLDWIEARLSSLPGQASALVELRLLRRAFASLPKNATNYGLIHYDFEPDNVFYDATTGTCSVIDFDDAMYHWYVMDIVQALDSLQGEVPAADFAEKRTLFLAGYQRRYVLEADLLRAEGLFRRFSSLYGYTRVARSIQEQWENEPEWLVGLRIKLSASLQEDAKHFGQPFVMQG